MTNTARPAEYQPGDFIRVRFGVRGSQVAEVIGVGMEGGRPILFAVRKWRRNSCRWSQPTYVSPSEVLGRAQWPRVTTGP
jgi:hypothetical protein